MDIFDINKFKEMLEKKEEITNESLLKLLLEIYKKQKHLEDHLSYVKEELTKTIKQYSS
jgi:hypothetical protein